jgi:DNA polymerase elongation subunit (family B)
MLDINSLYPSALHQFRIPTTAPKWFYKRIPSTAGYYIVEIDITAIHRPRFFYRNIKLDESPEASVRRTVDKYELEDLIKYCDIEYRVIKGYAWTKQTTSAHETYIEELYSSKQDAVVDDKKYFKLMINSIYGKLLQKNHNDVKYRRFTCDKQLEDKTIKHSARITKIDRNNKTFTMTTCCDTTFNYAFAGIAVQSLARRTMNEIFDRCDELGIEVLYSDTDGLLIESDRVHELSEFIGTELGKLHVERECDEAIIVKNKLYYLGDEHWRCSGYSRDFVMSSGNVREFYLSKSKKASTI